VSSSHCTGVNDNGGKFATSINNTSSTGGKFTIGVVDTGGKFSALLKLAASCCWCC
jgi:hypothetical protein